jgi:hypothetical protein
MVYPVIRHSSPAHTDVDATLSFDPISWQRSILTASESMILIDPDQCRPTITLDDLSHQ